MTKQNFIISKVLGQVCHDIYFAYINSVYFIMLTLQGW